MPRAFPPVDMPDGHGLRLMREGLGFSQSELAAALGFGPNGSDVIRHWEHGYRGGQPFKPTPVAWNALQFLVLLHSIYKQLELTDPLAACLRLHLPPDLQ